MKFTNTAFLRDQLTRLPDIESMETDFAGKTVIVSGSNTGLGLECARHIARMMGNGPEAGRLILACRNIAKAENALRSILRETTTYRGGEVWELDLADFDSIKAFAERFEKEGGGHLDLLIENSGINTREYSKTKDGWERTIQVNHLGTAMLAILMLPYLASAPSSPPFPRVCIVASETHYWTELVPKELESPNILKKLNEESYCNAAIMGKRYFLSKMLNIFFMRELSARTPSTSPVVVNAVDPGFCKSEILREVRQSVVINLAMNIVEAIIARTSEQGGRILVHAAVSTKPENMLGNLSTLAKIAELEKEGAKAAHGKFFHTCRITEESDFVISEKGDVSQKRLWTETIEALSSVNPMVTRIVEKYLATPSS